MIDPHELTPGIDLPGAKRTHAIIKRRNLVAPLTG
jgi:hypothetical protein